VIFINTLSKYLLFFLVLVYYQLRQSEPGMIILVNVVLKKFPDLKPFIEMIMKLKNAVAVLALSTAFGSAFANVYDLGIDPSRGFDRGGLSTGSFDDTFTFSISAPSISATSSSFTARSSVRFNNYFNITNFVTSLYSSLNPAVKLSAESIDGPSTNYSVGMGEYFYKVAGIATGNAVGGYNLRVDTYKSEAIPSPVPEPETYAMMLAGLGLLGFAARRKAKANQS
jgi:hypothetical protein